MIDEQQDVLAPLAQRRQLDLDRVEAEQQILAGTGLRRRAAPAARLVAAMTRTSIGTGLLAPTGVTWRCSSAVSNLGWRWSGRLPTSSRNRVPPSAAWSRPMRSPRASVKAPFTWPNSSDSNRFSATAPRSTETNTLSARARAAVELARDQLLAGAVLAEDQDIGLGRRGALDQRIDPRASPATGRAGASRRPPPARRSRPRACARSTAAWREVRSDAAVRTVASSRSFDQGLETKSVAPRFIASTAIWTPPWAVIITTTACGIASSGSRRASGSPRRRWSRRARNWRRAG